MKNGLLRAEPGLLGMLASLAACEGDPAVLPWVTGMGLVAYQLPRMNEETITCG